MEVDVKFINTDTEMVVGRALGSRVFLAFSPYPKGIKSKAKWVGISPENEGVARALASYFTQVADKYSEDAKRKTIPSPASPIESKEEKS